LALYQEKSHIYRSFQVDFPLKKPRKPSTIFDFVNNRSEYSPRIVYWCNANNPFLWFGQSEFLAYQQHVTLTRRQEHITPILRSLHWLPVHFRIIFKILLLTYKALNGLAPDYIRDLLRFNISGCTLRSSNNRLLDELRANLKMCGERAFSVVAPRLGNKLPLQIRLSSSEAVFKANLKTYLFKRSFDL